MRSNPITRYWLAHYVSKEYGLCSLCGNSGHIDTRATAVSAAGCNAGRINFCICPNGQAHRKVNKSKGESPAALRPTTRDKEGA